jgi:hypothetical protein
VGTGTKEDESITGRVWAAGFHHFTASSRLARFETYEPFISLIFQFFFPGRGYGGTTVFLGLPAVLYECHIWSFTSAYIQARAENTCHHQFLLLLVEHRASMKSFQLMRSPAIPLTSFHDLLVRLISSSIVENTCTGA